MPSLDFFNGLHDLRITESSFDLDFGQELGSQASGKTIVRDVRSPLWRAKFASASNVQVRVEELKALIESLGGSRSTFYAWCPQNQYPRNDPRGLIVGAANVQINALNGTDLRRLSFKGLPAGYVLRRGDLFAFDYTAVVAKRALHRVVTATVTANGSGVTPEFEISPPLRAGAAVNNVVNLRRPAAEFRLVPKTWSAPASGVISSVSIEAIQDV
jgi:hypothetical protein